MHFAKILAVFIVFALIQPIIPLRAQDLNGGYLPLDSIVQKFSKKNNLTFYYNPDWFEGKKLHISVVDLALDEFLLRTTQSCNCSIVTLNDNTMVYILPENNTSSNNTDINSVVLIGKMQEYGKFRQAHFSGKITDGKTGDLLPGASIYIDKIQIGTTTDKSGQFSMDIPVGDYEVKLGFVGYEESVRRIKCVSSGTTNFELFEKSVNLSEVVITTDKAEHNISRTQMSMVRMDAKTIKELPVSLGEVDILKSVSLLPGIQSSGEFGTGFFVRGGSSDQNLILLEDVPVFNSSHLFGLNSIINSDGIYSVTLLKAGIPAKYGERTSSVMDIRMGSGYVEKFKLKGGIGILNSKLSSEIPLIKNKLNVYLGGRTSYSNWLLHSIPDIDLKNSTAGFSDINSLVTYSINSNNKLSVFGYYSNDNFGIKNNVEYKYGNVLASIKWNHIFNHSLSTVFIAGLSHYNYYLSEHDTLRPSLGYKINSSVDYKNIKLNFTMTAIPNHTIEFGAAAINYQVNPGNLSRFDSLSLISPVNQHKEQAVEYGLYASDNFNITDKLSAEAGLRLSGYAYLGSQEVYQYNTSLPRSAENITGIVNYGKNTIIKNYSGLEPRVSLRYTIFDNGSLKLSFNRINQYINLVSNTTVMNPSDLWKLSNTYIKPLVCNQWAVGYFQNLKKNMYETSIEFYYKDLKNIIEYKDGASLLVNPMVDADLLNAGGYNYGVELYIKKSSGRLTGWLSYSLSKSMRHTQGTAPEEQVNKNAYFPSSFDKPHNLNFIGNYHISRRWRFSWTFTYNSGRPVTLPELQYTVGNNELIYYSDRNKYRIPDYHRLDIAITRDESLRIKKFWKGSWTISILNVYGRKNPYSVFFQRENNNFMSSSLYTLYIIGRPVPTLTYNFSF